MMRWKHLLLIVITIIFSYSCSAVKTSNLATPPKKELSAVTNVVPTNTQQPPTSIKSNKDKSNKENLLQQLDLSVEQKQQIEQVRLQYQQEIHQRQKNLKLLQKQLGQMMAGTDSAELIRAKNQELVQLHQEIGVLRFESMLATRELLTPQQRQKFRQLAQSQLN